ncbi:PRC-barrel domain-containing protein [Devosia sp.]|uniref:PRC-barrel domain-containing protein n=1 Tax=Devosia sp. TaxID=1871048 RepID=UPI0032656F73
MARLLFVVPALATLLCVSAFAQDVIAPAEQTELEKAGLVPPVVLSQGYEAHVDDRIATRIIGQKVYSSAATDAEVIGTVGDLVIAPDRTISAAVIDVGGFLGVGQKSVAVDFAQLQWVKDAEGKPRFVMTTTADALKAAPAFIWADSEEETGAAMTPAQEAAQLAPGDPNATATDPNQTTDQPSATAPLDRSKLTSLDTAGVSATELPGIAVYGVDEQIGSVNSVLTNKDGTIDALVVDVGGFLGLGAKPVAVGYENLKFSTDVNDTRYFFINATREQLEAQPPYDPATYESDRANQRLVIAP